MNCIVYKSLSLTFDILQFIPLSSVGVFHSLLPTFHERHFFCYSKVKQVVYFYTKKKYFYTDGNGAFLTSLSMSNTTSSSSSSEDSLHSSENDSLGAFKGTSS